VQSSGVSQLYVSLTTTLLLLLLLLPLRLRVPMPRDASGLSSGNFVMWPGAVRFASTFSHGNVDVAANATGNA